MEQYRTEEEQVEALRRWWQENGRSTVVAVIIGVSAVFGWQTWQGNELRKQEDASDLYQALLRVGADDVSAPSQDGIDLAEQLKHDFGGSTYAQFAALHLAKVAVRAGDLAEAQMQLRWVLGKASKGSDVARIAQLRLARVLASSGDSEQALVILADAGPGSYGASYAIAQGDIFLAAGRKDEARDAYSRALVLAGGSGVEVNLPVLLQKLQSLTPVPARAIKESVSVVAEPVDAVLDSSVTDENSGE